MRVVGEEVGLGEAELVVEDVEELALDAADVALAKDPGAERPVDVLERGVVEVLQVPAPSGPLSGCRREQVRTLLEQMSAPRKTRSHAHSSSESWRCGFARSR